MFLPSFGINFFPIFVFRSNKMEEKVGENEMAITTVKCPYCVREEVSLYGKSSTGAQRYLCRNKACACKTFQLEYKNNASKP